MGIAGYGYDWSSKGVERLEYSEVQKLIKRFDSKVEWDDLSNSPHFRYNGADNISHQVWYENSYSIKYKVNLAEKYNIGGIALWKLGEEDPEVWTILKKFPYVL